MMDQFATVGNDRIRSLFDAGSFVEVGAYVKSVGSAEEFDGVVCGYGAVNGRLTFAFAQDMDKMKGALDTNGAKKLRMLYDMAIKNGAPLVGVFDSAGAVISDGTAALNAYGEWLKCVADASGILPQIAVIDGVCSGMAAVAASMFDFTVTVKDKAKFCLVPGSDTCKKGAFAKNAENESEAFAFVRTLISMLPQNNQDKALGDAPAIGAIAEDAVLPDALFDGKTVTLYDGMAPETVVGFGKIGGETVGYVYAGGALTCQSGRKIAHMVNFCNSFGMTLVTVLDSEGYADDACAQSMAKLTASYAQSVCPKIALIAGKACGGAFTLLASKTLGTDLVFALPNTTVAAMTPARAVAFMWNDRITQEKTRAEVEAEWAAAYATPEKAAENGDIDDIIPKTEVRMRIASAVSMLAAKAQEKPARLSPVLPL